MIRKKIKEMISFVDKFNKVMNMYNFPDNLKPSYDINYNVHCPSCENIWELEFRCEFGDLYPIGGDDLLHCNACNIEGEIDN